MLDSQMPKLQPLVLRPEHARRHYQLLEPWRYDKYPAIGPIILQPFITDLSSIPKPISGFISPSGYLLLAGIIHDHLYKFRYVWVEIVELGPLRVGEERVRKKKIVKYWADRKLADQIFADIANISYPKEKTVTALAKGALMVGGWKAWNDHRKNDDDTLFKMKGVL